MRWLTPSLMIGVLGATLAGASTADAANLFTTTGITRSETRANSEIAGNPPYSLPGEEMPPSNSVGAAPDDAQDDVPLRMPDTSGTKKNFAAFRGQVLDLSEFDRRQYTKIHFFGTTTDGGPAGGDFILRYSDGSTQSITVRFPDWCQSGQGNAHIAIGPLSRRWRRTGEDGARCSIFHVPANAQAGKTLVSVTLPSTTTPGNAPIQGYLMALTLETADGVFRMPDLSGELQLPNDDKAPTTTHRLEPDTPTGRNGWYTSPLRVTLDSSDEGPAGVEQTMWRVDNGPPQPYNGPFTYTAEGAHRLGYRSVDAAGNLETFKTVEIKLDTQAPETEAAVRPQRTVDGWHDSAVTVSLIPADGEGSGPDLVEYSFDGGQSWTTYAGPFVVDRSARVEYRTTDVAGKTEPMRSLSVRVDQDAPATTARLNGAAPVSAYAGSVRVAFTRNDGEGSGAVLTEYRLDGGDWTEYTGAFDVTGLGGHRLDYRSSDALGNTENYRTVTFALTAPVFATPAPVTPAAAPKPKPFVSAERARLRGTRLSVRIACAGVDRGTLRLTVSRAVMRRLHLKTTTLAQRVARCGDEGRTTVAVTPSARVRRALARAKGRVDATLTLRFGAARDTQTVTFRGKS